MADHIEKIQERKYVELDPNRFLVPTTLGIGLVDGYDSMTFDISVSKPDLRREMEADMKHICAGRRTKDAVVQRGIDLYRDVFDIVSLETDRLDTALEQQLGPRQGNPVAHSVSVAVRRCPRCSRNDQVLRRTKAGK